MTDAGKGLLYCIIAFTLSAGAAGLAPYLGAKALNLAMAAPLIAVLVMMLVLTRDGTSRERWLALGLHRAGIVGWPLALCVPMIVLGAAYGAAWLTGVASLAIPQGIDLPSYGLDLLASIAIVALLGGIGEEIGWRGYLLPRLMGLGLYPALLLSGLAHGLYHLPVILWTPLYHSEGDPRIVVPLFLATLVAAGVCYGYLRLTTGSVWPAAIAHSTFNIVWDRLNAMAHAQSPLKLEYLAGESGVFTLTALSAVAAWLALRLRRRNVSVAPL